jgi:hypothetical protein
MNAIFFGRMIEAGSARVEEWDGGY